MRVEKFLLMATLLFAILTLFFLFGCTTYPDQNTVIGGDKDEHGCLIAAGYSYDSNVGACIRQWELDENQRKAALIVAESLSYENITIIGVVPTDCDGCYTVQFNDNAGQAQEVSIKNWEINYSDDLNENTVIYDSENKKIIYSFVVLKPTPCYEIKKDVVLLESYPVQIIVNVELVPLQTFAICAQVIDPEIVSGEITIDHLPGSFTVNVDGEQLFSISEISSK